MWKVISLAVTLSAFLAVAEAQFTCLLCNSTIVQPECITPTPSQFSVLCQGSNVNQTCFSRVDDVGNVVRGCFNQLDATLAADCESETCQICSGSNCNGEVFPERRLSCHNCNGGVNSTCAGVLNTTATVCPIYTREERCYIARPHGNYERGCLASSPDHRCGSDEPCFICSGEGCNYVDYSGAARIAPFAVLSIVLAAVLSQ